MSTADDDRDDTMLDRLNNIVEEGEEEDETLGEDCSIDDILVGDGGHEEDDDTYGDDGEEESNEEVATPTTYRWESRQADEGSDSNSFVSDFQLSGVSFDDLTQAHDSALSGEDSGTRPVNSLRGSVTRNSGGSVQSAPQVSRRLSPMPQRRRVSINVPMNSAETGSLQSSSGRALSRRRKSVSFKSMTGRASLNSKVEDDELSMVSSRLSGRVFSRRGRASNESYNSSFESVNQAMTTLGHGGNTEWENVAAAAAIVAAGSAGGTKRSHIQFAVDDKVLVFLNVLNHTNSVNRRDEFTVNPVNKSGYPRGEGKTSEELQGPFVYVLAKVKNVHFDEDLRYYTVVRADCGAEQRADTAWMEQIKSPKAIEAANRAAQQTSRSDSKMEVCEKEVKTNFLNAFLRWPVVFVNDTLKPLGRVAKAKALKHIELSLYGKNPYACQIRATGVNLLVCCSATYLLLESVALSFFPSSSDYAIAAIGATVWSILALELLLEWMIRPSGYYELIQSEKAYAPSTSRNINSFHIFFECLALALFIPEFICLQDNSCSELRPFSGLWASIHAVVGPTIWDACMGRFYIGLRALRMFALVRHWRIMRINNTFGDGNHHRTQKNKLEDEHNPDDGPQRTKTEEDQRLKKAATIGTSLLVVNSHRALFLLTVIVTILPMIGTILGVNTVADEMTQLLQQNHINAINCEHLEVSINAWLHTAAFVLSPDPLSSNNQFLLWAQISPSPQGCSFLNGTNGVITSCSAAESETLVEICTVWEDIAPQNPEDATSQYFAEKLGLREGGIIEYFVEDSGLVTGNFSDKDADPVTGEITFTVRALYNQNGLVAYTNLSSFLLLLCTLMLCLVGLAVLNGDAGRLVLNPLRRMLKIVVHYAENPLSQTAVKKPTYKRKSSKDKGTEGGEDESDGDRDKEGGKEQLGNYETEQLINAISKIADLLRKCWGVAGAGIISSNLARTEDGKTVVFNPTVPGKQVYALFGFVTINGFSDQLRALDRDVMILINDVAAVVHDEVFRWALGDSGQCNKNLGSSFLMVFRIGDFKEVHEKQARATDVVFASSEMRSKRATNLKRRKQPMSVQHGKGSRSTSRASKRDSGRGVDTLQLASLPGIQTFSDRALLGMLKSFAGILRDKELTKWKRDFRLGAGVGAYVVNIIIGMDAGWAVEGAVGSEYKIDATYLSPHVNMAARMMSATKQYGVTILLSQAVEELLSTTARSKLRHLDTVYVKGSSVSQRIFTYDARHHGVDFFLLERSPEQSDFDAENYSPMIWDNDADLKAMRQHITEEFIQKFKAGKDLYLAGNWKAAVKALKEADDMMIAHVLDEGYTDYNTDEIDGRIFDRRDASEELARIHAELGDGPCNCLIAYMEKRNSLPPDDWKGVRPLTSK